MLTVGQPWPHGTLYPNTMGFHIWSGGQCMLLVSTPSPRPDEIASFHSTDGWVEFALVPIGDLLVTVVKFPDAEWADSSWANVEGWEPPDLDNPEPPNERYQVMVCLADSDSGLVAGLRAFTLSPHYSQMFYKATMDRMARPPISLEEFNRQVTKYQADHPRPKTLLPRALVRCKAGLP